MTSTFTIIALSLFTAGFVKGIFGMGLPAVSLGLLSLFMPPVEAATIIVIPTLITNAWQYLTGERPMSVFHRFRRLTLGVAVGTTLGVGFLTGVHTSAVSLALGIVLILYALVGLLGVHFTVTPLNEKWLAPIIGVATGIVNGATGVSVMPLIPYLNSLQLPRDALIQTMGLVFMIAMLSLAACLAWTGHLKMVSAYQSLLACVPVFAGMYLGQLLRLRLHPERFRRWFLAGLIALGMYSVIRAVA